MRNTSVAILAALALLAVTSPARSQDDVPDTRDCTVRPAALSGMQAASELPDVVAVFISSVRVGTRVTVGLMDNQKLKGEFLGVQDGRLLLRADRDRATTLRIPFLAIHSVKVKSGGAIERP